LQYYTVWRHTQQALWALKVVQQPELAAGGASASSDWAGHMVDTVCKRVES